MTDKDSAVIRRCNGNREAWIVTVTKGCLGSSFTSLSLDYMVRRLESEGVKQVKIDL